MRNSFLVPLVLGAVTMLLMQGGIHWFGFSIIRGDLAGYMEWSYGLVENRVGWHLPGYPILLAVGRLLTLGVIPDAFLAQSVMWIAWVGGLVFAHRILEMLAPEYLKAGLLLYAIYPLIGVTHVAWPIADNLAQTIFLGALYFQLRRQWYWFMAFTAYGLLIHMALWPFLCFLCLASIWKTGFKWWQMFASGIPLMLFYIGFGVLNGDLFWFFKLHYKVNFQAASSLPIFDGLIGTLLSGSLSGLIKLLLVLPVFALATVLSVRFCRQGNWTMLALTLPVVIYGMFLNQQEIWAVFRFSRFLVIPACIWMVEQERLGRVQSRPVYSLIAVLLIASQVVWGMYVLDFHGAFEK